jgi:RHS repeat-associated protein
MQSPGSQGTRDASTPEIEEVFSLAADPQLAENSRQGSERKNRAFALGFEELKSQTMQWGSWQASGRTASVPTVYLYDGLNTIEEMDGSGSVLAKYTHGAVVDEDLAMLRNGTASYYHQDGLGSITSLSSSTGALANTYTYDAFGRLTASTGSLTNPFQYTGREFDSETGLYSNRARYFDPSAGRFLSQDPIRFSGGTNFYAYVRNNPAVFKDVLGYQGCNASQWAQSPGACGGPTDPNSPYEGSDGLWYNVTEWSPPPPLLPWPPSNDETDSQCECNPWTLAERSEEIWQEETNADEHTVGWGVAKDVGGTRWSGFSNILG